MVYQAQKIFLKIYNNYRKEVMVQTNTIEKADILSRDEYKIKRKSLREKMVLRKKFRRVDIGPYVTMYFENKDTIIHQINEMVYIEDGGEQQIDDEILAYKSLIPNGSELVATVMVEIDNPIKRAEFLSKMGGFEETINIKINDKEIKGKAELDGDRTTADGKASSVQFVHFEFDEQAVKSIKNNMENVSISINHKSYRHSVILNTDTVVELTKDFYN